MKKAAQLISESERYNRNDAVGFNLMVVGVPNVGKSSLINALRAVHMRKPSSLQVAPEAGLTKNVHEKIRVSISPAMYLFDTPGIMNPNINTMETGLRLASCGMQNLSFVPSNMNYTFSVSIVQGPFSWRRDSGGLFVVLDE